MTLMTLESESRTQHGFYVPRFEVRIQGVGLPQNVVRDVTQLTYHDDIKKVDGFELTVQNWDPVRRAFKYLQSDAKGGTNGSTKFEQLFEPGAKEVEVWLGYMGNLTLMLTGRFTTMEPSFPMSGPPTLTVRGLNSLNRLRTTQFTTAWSNEKPSDIAKNIATLTDPNKGGKKRFPLPIVTSPPDDEKPIEHISQANQYDIDFLLSLARQYGYVVVILEPNPKGKGVEAKQRLYFGPSQAKGAGLRDVTFVLEWGKTLQEFKPTLTVAKQIKSVTVNGWNRQTKKPIVAKISIDDKALNLNRDLHDLFRDRDEPHEEVVVDEPVFTTGQARARAIAILTDRHKEIVKASGTTVGLPELRAGRRVQIKGLGPRFNGSYFVTDTTHTMGEKGYTTRFNARREEITGGAT